MKIHPKLGLLVFSLLTLAVSGCFPVRVDSEGRVIEPPKRTDIGSRVPLSEIPVTPVEEDGILANLGNISERTLPVGECGLFLWARTPEQKLVFFANTTRRESLIRFQNRDIALTLDRAEQELPFGLYGAQELSGAGLRVSLRLEAEAREGMTDGALIPRASLRLTTVDGWDVFLPTAGIVGCQTESDATRR